MRAILCQGFGPQEELVLKIIENPEPGPGQVLIRVRAAALNFFDTLIIEGRYQVRPELPFSPAGEIAGVIEAVGEGVDQSRIGERVLAHIGWGGARDYVAIDAQEAITMPPGIAFEEAAGLIITYGTTIHALRARAKLKEGESLAVLGAAGGVGLAAVEVGKLMGARVIACASSDDKLALCLDHGADVALNYTEEDLKSRLKELTEGNGVDVVYDPVGGGLSEEALRATRWYGRYLVIGFASGTIPKMPLNLVMLKGVDMLGVFWGEAIKRNPPDHETDMKIMLDWVASGALQPHIYRTFPLEETGRAIKAIAKREAKGKIIISL